MKQQQSLLLLLFSTVLTLSTVTWAKESSRKLTRDNKEQTSTNEPSESKSLDLLKALDYPELQVVPRASDRLKIEAVQEANGWLTNYWAFQMSGLTTLGVGMMGKGMIRGSLKAEQQVDADAAILGAQVVGAGWLLGSIFLGMQKPYEAGYRQVRAVKGKDKRSALLRERLAEESLERSAKLMTTLTYGSMITNAGASLYLATFMSREGTIYAAAAAAVSLLPMIFPHRHIVSWGKHQEYKRKIYVPFTSMNFRYDRASRTTTPYLAMNWNF